MSKVIILGCKHGGLAAIRSFKSHGIHTIGVTHDPNEFGLKSRYLDEWHLCPHPEDSEALVNFLLERGEAWAEAMLYETTDFYLSAISKHKDRLSQYYKQVTPEWEIAQQFLEKNLTYQLADACGVPHPGIFNPQSMDELDALVPNIRLPVMVKPILSHEFQSIFHTKLFICETIDDLRSRFKLTFDSQQAVVISEIIPGSDYLTLERVQLYINSKSDVAVTFCHLKVRQTPPMYGVMRVGKSTEANSKVVDLALRLLKGVDYQGFASVEFKRDLRDNSLKLMEVNIRAPRSNALSIGSGVDFPYLIYQDLMNDEQIKVEAYHPNTYLIDLVSDLANFVTRDSDRSLGRFVRPYLAQHKVFSVLSLDDPRPFLKLVGGHFRKMRN